jgi:hypothetical protein
MVQKTGDHKRDVVCEAIWWAYQTARSPWPLEWKLYNDEDLTPFIDAVVEEWDGEEYLSGASKAAYRVAA